MRASTILVIVGLIAHGGVLWAQDSSELPAEIMPLADQSLLLDLVDTGERLVAVGERGHVLLSDDGRSWRQSAGVPTRSTLTAVTAVGDQLWAVGHDVVIIHSSDGGETWTLQQADSERMQPLLDVHFLDESTGIAVGAYGYFVRTEDGGETWEEGLTMASGEDEFAEDDDLDEQGDDAGDDEVVPTTGAYDFSDYEDEITDFHMNGIAELDDGTLYIAAEAGTGLLSADGGISWRRLELPYGGSMFGVLSAPDGTLVTYGLRGHVLESDDGGETWVEQDTGTLNSLMGAARLEDGRVVMVGANGEVLVRTASGAYRSSSTAAGDDLAAVVPLDDGSLQLVGESGLTRHPLDGDRS